MGMATYVWSQPQSKPDVRAQAGVGRAQGRLCFSLLACRASLVLGAGTCLEQLSSQPSVIGETQAPRVTWACTRSLTAC